MTIENLKELLTIEQVIRYYGYKTTRSGAMFCPFHERSSRSRKKPFQIYKDTNRFHCFKDGCVGNGDIIDFICHQTNSDTKTALDIAVHDILQLPKEVPTDGHVDRSENQPKKRQVAPVLSKETSLKKLDEDIRLFENKAFTIKIYGRLMVKNFDRLRFLLHITPKKKPDAVVRENVDFYNIDKLKRFQKLVSDRTLVSYEYVQSTFSRLADLLEKETVNTRKTARNLLKTRETVKAITEKERKEMQALLKSADLITLIDKWLGESGIIGEEQNRQMLFYIGLTRKMNRSLHALIQGSSGSGKTHLLKGIVKLHHPEVRHLFTRITEHSFYNWPEDFLVHKIIGFEDMDGLKEEAQFALREIMSNNSLTSGTSLKNEGNTDFGTGIKVVLGPVTTFAATTKGDIYEDNESRIFTIAVDESSDQTQRIIDYQNAKQSGKVMERTEKQAKRKLFIFTELYEPKATVNHYAGKLVLPEKVRKKRRLNALLNCFIEVITLVYQHQRKADEHGRIITEKQDIENAINLMFDTIVLKSDELDGSLRQFFENLKDYLKDRERRFSQREIRQQRHISKTQLHRYLTTLLELEYIEKSGYANRGYSYQICYWDNYKKLRRDIKENLQNQLKSL